MPSIHAGDLHIHYLEAGDGEPVIFLHGNWATAAWWEPTLARLPAGYRGLAPDLRGRGETTGPDTDYSIAALAGDLLAFADSLGLARLHLVGHSLGAAIALQAALENPTRVLTLTVVAPPWPDGMPEELNLPDRQRMLKDQPEFFAQALKFMAPTAPDDAYWRRLVEAGRTQSIEVSIANLDALCAWRPGDRLAAITAPTLVLGGTLDPLTTAAVVERMAAALGVTATILPDVGHSVIIEQPDLFMELLAAQLRRA